MANVPNGVETLPKILSPEYDARTLQTTDRQTDGRTTTYRERECEFTFAKNETNLCPHSYTIRKIIHHSYLTRRIVPRGNPSTRNFAALY